MKRRQVLIDAGPLVSIVSCRDAQHERCVAELALVPAPLLTCWAVLVEALWIVRQNRTAVASLFQGFADGFWALAPIGQESLVWIDNYLKRYHDLGAQLADVCLVYLAERDEIDTVFTLDRRDFSVYRYGKNRHLKIIPGPA